MDLTPFADDIRKVLEERGAIIYAHYVFRSSGLHSNMKFDMEILCQKDPVFAAKLCRYMADATIERHLYIDCVVGVETGGIFVAEHVSMQLNAKTNLEHPCFIATKIGTSNKLRFNKNSQKALNGKRVFLVDDVVTSGSSLMRAKHLIQDAGGTVVGIGVLCDRSRKAIEFGVSYFYTCYTEENAELWTAEQCPACNQ